MAHRILLLEDEQAIADTLLYSLRSEGFEVTHVPLVRDALAAFARQAPDLAILDVGLPDGNGFDVCRAIRKTSELPIVFLTARSEEIDRILGLELGADDYVSKPFSPREVCARAKAILRRSAGRAPDPAVQAEPLLQLASAGQLLRWAALCWWRPRAVLAAGPARTAVRRLISPASRWRAVPRPAHPGPAGGWPGARRGAGSVKCHRPAPPSAFRSLPGRKSTPA